METKASYTLVGACVLLAILVFVGVIMFGSKSKDKTNTMLCMVYFDGGVSGLSTGNAVQLNGVRIGSVKDIRLSEEDQSRVQVLMEIDSRLDIRQDWRATAQIHGITGQSIINISGGKPGSPPLQSKSGESVPVIPSEKSTMDHLASEAPNLIDSANRLLNRASGFLSDENQENLAAILRSTASISSTLAEQSEKIGPTMDSLHESVATLQKLLGSADGIMDKDLRGAVVSAKRSFDQLNRLLGEAEPELQKFSRTSLDELGRLLSDTRQMVRSLDRVIKRIESNPRSLLLGDSVPEYQPR